MMRLGEGVTFLEEFDLIARLIGHCFDVQPCVRLQVDRRSGPFLFVVGNQRFDVIFKHGIVVVNEEN